ncbi:DUF1565 domain-containing protein [Companilactobacillus halodurans]|uniref:DUF1565 domain-containing protein n=1 Tax=Companilactobacillus halodurans TaxID=2584183 RepID=A0A5P0ZUW1_9LACO|nr:DUF1565 domain-containing protein [Companilactobacillus halodurans]MQS75065.1 DUF1565 domain-containing protein [Companilactobacillus halodurans]MQS96866.1 DUF1565 domain-containing protein [Companilactobacillus halodurans]
MKITIGNQNNTDELLSSAIVNARDGDIIELMPGEYFSKNNPFICTVRRNITIVGKSNTKGAVKLYCSFTIGADCLVIFKNLTINYTADSDNTLSAYDGAKVYGNNITIDRNTSDDWDTIYGQNASFSFKDSNILTGAKTKAIGLSLENSQLFADSTFFQLLFQKNSTVFLRNSFVAHKLELRRHSQLFFKNLTVDSTKTLNKNDLAVKSSSEMIGQDLIFIRNSPQIRILKSSFAVDNFEPESQRIHFKFDEASRILVDGRRPPTD